MKIFKIPKQETEQRLSFLISGIHITEAGGAIITPSKRFVGNI